MVCRGGFHDYLFGCTRDVTKPAPTQGSRFPQDLRKTSIRSGVTQLKWCNRLGT
ncbi:hypothetical protein MC7420_4201 [Coleofasciculus chthonoplastes PCC 7420]|uniref:Uncharacterized protein n=1 Tax=Coleofasciculus chthonoplastes PCC 7420 TaxID=118168 RepID=B4VUY8_9CYAN|nr:hypothetical protein MC7420_4201 [Coleofasciculus chthonoplastes PCC 7420]